MNPVKTEETEPTAPARGTAATPPFAENAQGKRYAGCAGDNSLARALGYFILRLSLGVDMLMHYVVRTWGVSQDFVLPSRKKCSWATCCRCHGCTTS